MNSRITRLSQKKKEQISTSPVETEEPNSAAPQHTRTKVRMHNSGSESETDHDTTFFEHDTSNEIKESLKQILVDTKFLEPLVSSIVSTLLQTPDIFNKLVDAVTKSLSNTISEKLKPDLEQSIHDSVLVDIQTNKRELEKLKQDLNKLKNEKTKLETQFDDAEQYSRRNCLLLHGVPEVTNEDTTAVVTDIIKNKLKINIDSHAFDRTHRLGRPNRPSDDGETPTKPRPIIMKFISYANRAAVYKEKRLLKRSPMLISENLTAKRMKVYRAAYSMVKEGKLEYSWTQDGRITVLTHQNRKVSINSIADLERF